MGSEMCIRDRCTFNNNPRAASIDTPLHAYVPFPEVDHTHPDSIIALATMHNGKDIIKKVYNNKIGWLDWQRPGFDLGLKMEQLIKKFSLSKIILVIKNPPREDVISAYGESEFLILPSASPDNGGKCQSGVHEPFDQLR